MLLQQRPLDHQVALCVDPAGVGRQALTVGAEGLQAALQRRPVDRDLDIGGVEDRIVFAAWRVAG
jgi:hypothetical protein